MPYKQCILSGPVEADPEYQLIVEANTLAAEIDNDINVVHKFLRDKYQKRFPELETVVPTPIEYIKCVNELRNQILEKSKEESATLLKILPSSTVMVVSVTASTTQGIIMFGGIFIFSVAFLQGSSLSTSSQCFGCF